MDDTAARGDRFEVVCLRPEIHSTMVNLFIFCEVEGFMAAIHASSSSLATATYYYGLFQQTSSKIHGETFGLTLHSKLKTW